ncbi:MAG: hypothetical protein FWD29_08615 [Micrococcales bacterium]|nr:hypothetical protein [Micrococcales bacterium]
MPEDTPLGPYRPFLDGPVWNPEEQYLMRKAEHEQRERIIAGCMKESGFNYYPTEYGGSAEGLGSSISDMASTLYVPPLDADRSHVERWGYGVDPDTVDTRIEDYSDPADAQNQAYVNGLSPSARSQYNVAFIGYAEVIPGQDQGIGGCVGNANGVVPEKGVRSESFDANFNELAWAVKTLTFMDVPSDSAAVKLNREWSQCMMAAGIDVTGGQEIIPSNTGYLNQATPLMAFFYARSLENSDIATDDSPRLIASPAQVEVAVADYDCRAQTDYFNRILDVQIRVERSFLDLHRAELNDMRAAAREEY